MKFSCVKGDFERFPESATVEAGANPRILVVDWWALPTASGSSRVTNHAGHKPDRNECKTTMRLKIPALPTLNLMATPTSDESKHSDKIRKRDEVPNCRVPDT